MNNPADNLVSIIIPAFNAENFLDAAIQSAIAQTYKNIEILIINDGSIDSTEKIINTWRLKDPRIKYFRHAANKGLPAARNTGLSNAAGSVIALLDSDDVWEPQKLEAQMSKLQEADIVYANARLIDERGRDLGGNFWDSVHAAPQRGTNRIRDLFKKDFIVPASSVVFRKSIIQKVGLFDERLRSVEDYDFWLRAIYQNSRLDFVDDRLLAYRLNQNQMSEHAVRMEYWRIFVLSKFVCQHPGFALQHPILLSSRIGKRILAFIYKLIFKNGRQN